ncbi:hypothetical protein DBR06_SOUSAS27910010 [Sousa chinensis]|uniref:Pentraxin (PTX) domain-containing protein n=1 Tax=Sousa chinensis TaxID=103600 RepID=A0A484GRM5_SOUCH|nr:hypothetical protein DBR06_SOUSAS27910010 [Sousa chinensis]
MVCKEEMNQRMPSSRLKTGLSKSLPGTSDMGRRDQSHISTLSIQCTLNPQLHSLDIRRGFLFPRESITFCVSLILQLEKLQQKRVLSCSAFTDISLNCRLLVSSMSSKDGESVLVRTRIGEYSLYHGALVSGKALVRKGLWQRPFVGAHPKTVLGQEQDSFGNGFHKAHSLWK